MPPSSGKIFLIDPETRLITFTPDGFGQRFTDPSYHIPAFYEVWAKWADDGRSDYWLDCARKSREFLRAVGHHCAQHPRSVATRFVKGREPHNKGKRIDEFMSAEGIERSSVTRFKKGHLPHNTKPIGYERVDPKDGYIFIKVSMSGKMVAKHRYIWEQAHGKIPDGYLVSFRDGNRHNCDLSNLYLLSREENARSRILSETPEARQARVANITVSRNKSIRRDKIRIHWGMEPIGKLVKRW